MSAVSLAGFCWSTRDNIEGAYVPSEVSHWFSKPSVGLSPLYVIQALPTISELPQRLSSPLSLSPPPFPFSPKSLILSHVELSNHFPHPLLKKKQLRCQLLSFFYPEHMLP